MELKRDWWDEVAGRPNRMGGAPQISFGTMIDAFATMDDGPAATDARRKRVLVVDDDSNVASALAMLLEVQGYEVAVGLSGNQAIELAADLSPRAVFLDIGMEGMDGFEAGRRLRRSEPDPARRLLIAVSGYDDEAFLRACREAGFDHHLTKPVDRNSLRRVLDELG